MTQELAEDIARLDRMTREELDIEVGLTKALIASGRADAEDLQYWAELQKRTR
ncbi:hypothetical protein ACFXJ8_12010 [Nonomuraea sp. NPDC059194]|uniref:hypothetical protein n=1 Tax=Nonomuraea sp. NPDC059194 TaxID=3346764 RepID=UPI00368DD5CD